MKMTIKRIDWGGIPLLLAAFLGVIYLICFGGCFLLPEQYRMFGLLRQLLPWFEVTGTGFIIGLVESLIYGYVGGLLLVAIYNWVISSVAPIRLEE